MAAFTESIDTQVSIYQRVGNGPAIGTKSKWVDTPVPGTGKTIEGFIFDDKRWGGILDENEAHFVPVLWDPSTIGVKDYISPGIGDNNDLLLTSVQSNRIDGDDIWQPRLHHGFYYSENEEYYLHSDDAVVDIVPSGLVASGGNTIQLSYVPKPGIPILARGYKWDSEAGTYLPDRTIRKVIELNGEFTESGQVRAQDGDTIFWENVNTSEEEWTLNYSTVPPTAIFNQDIAKAIGQNHITISGLSQFLIDELDLLGVANGYENEQFHLTYSPVSRDHDVTIYSDYYGTSFQVYSIVEDFTVSGVNEVKLDYDLGTVTFGSSGEGGLVPYGVTVRAAYTKTVGIEYEPEHTKDYIESNTADLNPIRRFSGNGFVFIRNRSEEIASLELEALLPEISSDFYGPLLLGNNFATIQATAYSLAGEPVEGQEITFEIIGADIGTFGASDTSSAYSNSRGQARTLYNPPRTIDDLGGVTDDVTITASGSQLFLSEYSPASDSASLFLFQIAREDNILGIPRSQLPEFYEAFLAEEDLEGPYITHNLSSSFDSAWDGLSLLLQQAVKWEVWHRTVHGLATPVTYEPGDLRTGKKTVIAQFDATAVNPHTGTTPAIVPVQPLSYTIDSSGLGTTVSFEEELPLVASGTAHRAYMVVGPSKVAIRAKTTNATTGQIILSNTIEILIDIPDAAKGLFDIETLNSIPSGLLNNANLYEQSEEDLEEVQLLESTGLLPLGWRIRSTGITLASALNGLTFLDLNPLNQSYQEDDVTVSGEYLNSISHQFEVDI
jgi:hypothetical protein